MQKARRHPTTKSGSDRLRAHGFRDSFTPLQGVLFTFPSRYWFTIGLTGVFSLAGWSRRVRAGFHVPRATQDATGAKGGEGQGAFTRYGAAFQHASPTRAKGAQAWSYNPGAASPPAPVWAAPRSLAATGGITVVFLSSGY